MIQFPLILTLRDELRELEREPLAGQFQNLLLFSIEPTNVVAILANCPPPCSPVPWMTLVSSSLEHGIAQKLWSEHGFESWFCYLISV